MIIGNSNSLLPQNSLGRKTSGLGNDAFNLSSQKIPSQKQSLGQRSELAPISSLHTQNLLHLPNQSSKEAEFCLEEMLKTQNDLIETKTREMNELLKRMHINGEVTSLMNFGGTPGHDNLAFDKYFVNREGNSKNLIIFDFGHGRLRFVEVDYNDPSEYLEEFERALGFLSSNGDAVSDERQQAAIARFFGSDSLKCLLTELREIISSKGKQPDAILLQYEKFQDEVIEELFSVSG